MLAQLQTTVQRRLYAQLPIWARPDYIVLRYIMRNSAQRRRDTALRRTLAWLIGLGVVLALVAFSYSFAESNNPLAMDGPRDSLIFTSLYFPLLILQFVALMMALLTTSGLLVSERARGTWEAFKITSHGAEAVIRARWAATFYQLRWLLLLIMLPRILFAGMMLIDLTDYQGYHLDLYISGITPGVSLEVAVVLLAASMTASLLMMLVMLGLNAAVGLALSALFVNRGWMTLARIFVFGLQIALFVVAFDAGHHALSGFDPFSASEPLSQMDQWLGLWSLGVFGDQGLMFMDLETFLQTWTDVDYGVLMGLVQLVTLLLLAVITNGMLLAAARRASRPERE